MSLKIFEQQEFVNPVELSKAIGIDAATVRKANCVVAVKKNLLVFLVLLHRFLGKANKASSLALS